MSGKRIHVEKSTGRDPYWPVVVERDKEVEDEEDEKEAEEEDM